MSIRPFTTAFVVATFSVVGTGAVLFGAFWLVVAAGAVAFLDPVGGLFGIVGLLGIASIGYATAAFVAAVGLVRGRPWAWIASFHIAIVAVVGSLIASVTAGPQPAVLIGAALSVVAMAALFTPSIRAAS